MSTSSSSPQFPHNYVHMVLMGKGGVGKSFTATVLLQYLLDRFGNVKAFDTDPVNKTLFKYKALPVEPLELMENNEINERKFDDLIGAIVDDPNSAFVIDNGASSFISMANFLLQNEIGLVLSEVPGRKLVIHCVVTGGLGAADTFEGFRSIADQIPNVDIVVWKNGFFGEVGEDGVAFEETPTFRDRCDRVSGIVNIPALSAKTFGQDVSIMHKLHRTFEEVRLGTGCSNELSLLARRRLDTVRAGLYSQLDAIFRPPHVNS